MTEGDPDVENQNGQDAAGSGAYSLAGYDYQIDVSIWLALDLLLANRVAQSIELEPATEEDIEAELADSDPGRLSTQVASDGYRLVVQAKLRNGDAWTVLGLKALLKHGSKDRLSAAHRLADPGVRYLLVTSAGLNGDTRGLSVGRAGNWPKRSGMPASIVSALPAEAAGRVGVIGNLDADRLIGEIKRLLIERFGVPFSRWIDCLKKLREEARLRVVHQVGGGHWKRGDLAHIIRDHDGYLAASPQLENYVYPKNWSTLRDTMDSPRYAAFIIGQSGTGKTLATSKLYEVMRVDMPGLTRVPIRHGPQQLRDDQTSPPVLYDIEDPWGRYDFDPSSRPWNDQLGQFLARATHDRRIVVTSRRDVGISSGALKTVEDWLVPLEVEHYGTREKQKLYRTRIETLPRDVQLLAKGTEKQVLDQLASPLEIEKFFDALRTSGRPDLRNPSAFINAAIDRAHEEAIEFTVVQQIQEREDIPAAAVIWALLKASDKLSIRAVRSLEVELAERDPRFEKGITPLIDFFAAARNLRVGEGDATYYHPRVEGGIMAALKQAAVAASLALRALIDALTDPEGPDQKWGGGVAARITHAVGKVSELNVPSKPAPQAVIDRWIDQQFTDPATRIPEHMRLAAAVGSTASVGAEFARYIDHRPDQSFPFFMHWSSPGYSQAWYDRMREAPQTMTIATRFVREMLPEDRTSYGAELVDDLDRIAPGLTPVYLEATAGIIHHGFDPAVTTLAEGALQDLAGFEAIVDAAAAELTWTEEQLSESASERLAFLNGVYSDEYEEHMSSDETGHTAGTLLRAYVDKVRVVKGWRSLAQHRHAGILIDDWMRSLTAAAREEIPTPDEVAGAYDAASGTEYEHAVWDVLKLHWDEAYFERLKVRVLQGAIDEEVRTAALDCLIAHCPKLLPQIMDDLVASGDQDRAVELAIDLGIVVSRSSNKTRPSKAKTRQALALLPPPYQAIAAAGQRLQQANAPSIPLPPPAAELLTATPGNRPLVRRLRIQQHEIIGSTTAVDIEKTLTEADISWKDDQACAEAIKAAVAMGLTEVLENGLDHMFTSVVVPSLKAVGEPLPAPLPQGLLELSKAKGKPVREELLSLLVAKPHHDHIPTLMDLAHDEWSSSYRSHDEADHYPIAREAIIGLSVLGSLPAEELERLDALAIGTTDPGLRDAIFELLVKRGGQSLQERLLDRACSPGRAGVRKAAAHAILNQSEELDTAIVGKIDSEFLATRIPGVASRLMLTVGLRATDEDIVSISRHLAARPKRRVLLLLAIWVTRETRPELSRSLEALMPLDHPAIAWLRSGPSTKGVDSLVSDLGDAAVCSEVLSWLNPAKTKV
ncbi:hypothetical protein ASF91_20730 [Rhizobium sp. Leaf155]|nr:hypothetical protein ASF91_20730 [Rhizobium sp. Leaf155]